MEGKIKLIPGVPRDENRDYLPLYLKDRESKFVVNEGGNNSQVYPERLKEFKEKIIDDVEDEWYVYVPESYDPSKKTPLVFSMHGGIMSGWAQCVYTSWSLVADREGFIVVFPSAHLRGFWQIECEPQLFELLSTPNDDGIFMHPLPENLEEDFDVKKVFTILERVKSEYNIDEERIYMQGMSLGNAMTAMMARHFGDRFAAMAGSAGPSTIGLLFDKDDNPINEAGPVNIWQTRMEHDQSPPGSDDPVEEVVAKNREYWLRINECNKLPVIRTDGESAFAFYKGEKADFGFREVKNRDHGQTFDEAELCWDYFFSGCKRTKEGRLEYIPPVSERVGDNLNFAVGADCEYAWVNNDKKKMPGVSLSWQKLKYHGLNGDAIVRGNYTMVPVSFLAESFGAKWEESDGRAVITMADGGIIQFARGIIGCTVDNHVRSMLVEPIERNGMLYISAEWFLREIMQLHVSVYEDMIYATDHYSTLGPNMTRLIRDIISK